MTTPRSGLFQVYYAWVSDTAFGWPCSTCSLCNLNLIQPKALRPLKPRLAFVTHYVFPSGLVAFLALAPALCGSCPWGHSQVHLRGMLHALRAGRPRPSAGHAQPRRDRQVCLDAQLRGLLWVLLLLLWLCCGSSQVGTTACRGARWRPLYHDEPSRLHMSLPRNPWELLSPRLSPTLAVFALGSGHVMFPGPRSGSGWASRRLRPPSSQKSLLVV